MTLFNKSKVLVATGLLTMAGAANAGYTIDVTPDDKITFGGYIKADVRYTDGDIAAREYWIGTAGATAQQSQTHVQAHVNETRFNAKYVHGDVTGFIEMDFFGTATTGGGTEDFSNSSNPRLRHAFIKYKNVLVGQTWTTFQNTSALAEAADFGGPLVSAAFVRQAQVRYTNGGLQLSLENPETRGTGAIKGDDSLPDVIAKYTFKDDWGNVSVAGVLRKLNSTMGNETAFGYGIAGRINTVGKDDFRFQLHAGETGRYVGVAAANDIANGKVEETTAISVAYRHFWTDDTRSTVFYGNTTTDETDIDNTHWGVNYFKNYTKQLSVGIEVGNFEMDSSNRDSNYVQLSAKYVL